MKPPILVAVFLLVSAPQVREVQLSASIEGVVVKAGTNEPIAGATIELTGIAPRTVEGATRTSRGAIAVSVQETGTDGRVLSFTTETDRNGRFLLRNVPPTTGYHLIAVRQPDFLPAQYGQRVPAVPGQSIALTDGQQLQNLRIEMTPSASISGRVIDASGQGVGRVSVELRRPWYLEGWRLIADWQETVSRVRGVGRTNRAAFSQTNEFGEFSFDGLPPAHYYVRTSATSDTEAPVVHLHAGENVQGLKLAIPQIHPRRVRGVIVRTGTGALAEPAAVALVKRGAVPLYQRAITASGTSRQGFFELVVREPGDYLLMATNRGSPGFAFGRKAIRVGDADVDVGQIEMVPAFDLAGTVVVEDRAGSLQKVNVPLLLSLYSLVPGTPAVSPVALTVPRGTFSLRAVTAGDFRVEVSPILTVPSGSVLPPGLENAYVKSVRLGRTDVLAAGLHLESRPEAGLEVVISTHGGSVQGRVLDDGRKPSFNTVVTLVPDNARRSRGDLYKSVLSDDAGRFQLRGIPPGDYKLFAWERVEDGAWQDPEFIKLYEDRGARVRIAEDGQQTVDVTRIPAWN